jgi:hypothetical protein
MAGGDSACKGMAKGRGFGQEGEDDKQKGLWANVARGVMTILGE